MRSEGFPKRFTLNCWVEGPLEGMMDLSQDMEGYKKKIQSSMGLGTAIMLAFLAILTIVLAFNIWILAIPFFNALVTWPADIAPILTFMAMTIVFIAATFIATILLLQVWRYISVMLKRFENVEDLLGMSVAPESKPTNESETSEEQKSGLEKLAGHYKGLFNILGASGSFTKDLVQNMPQVCKQMNHMRNLFFLMPVYYLILVLVFPPLFGDIVESMLPHPYGPVLVILIISLSVLSVISGLILTETARFMELIHARLCFIDKINNSPMAAIEDKPTSKERLEAYLKKDLEDFKPSKSTGKFLINQKSEDLIVMALETNVVPDIQMVKDFISNIRKELSTMASLPSCGRFILLYSPDDMAEDIDDKVTDFILANPISLGRGPGGASCETVVQIMIEEEGVYGLFPFVM